VNSLLNVTLQDFMFYLFAGITLLSALMVVSTRYPVRSVLYLVLAFVASASLWMLLESEFLSLVLIFVYVGAVMTLFLFVVMMLNLEVSPVSRHKPLYLLAGLLITGVLAFLMLHSIGFNHFSLKHYPTPPMQASDYSNTYALGTLLYTHYVLAFELAAIILLVAIIAAIGIAFRGVRPDTRSQQVMDQLQADPKTRVRLVNMKPEKRL